MAFHYSSNKLLTLCFLACKLLFVFSDNHVVGKSNKVKLNLYYESLCPYCQNFIINGLFKIFDSDLYKIIDFKLVPFGNAKVSANRTVTCQHGEEECKLNAIEACAIRTWPDPKWHYKFIRCVEMDTKNWNSCTLEDPRSEKSMNDCYNGNLSYFMYCLILGYAKQTLNLNPKKTYVPWVTLNGKPLYESYEDFVPQVCNAYKGKAALPKLCNSISSHKKKTSKLRVSYTNETTFF
ncbi:unnamed protein product [Cochlearia groenlandica]